MIMGMDKPRTSSPGTAMDTGQAPTSSPDTAMDTHRAPTYGPGMAMDMDRARMSRPATVIDTDQRPVTAIERHPPRARQSCQTLATAEGRYRPMRQSRRGDCACPRPLPVNDDD